jgi:5-hydroxyisourate hydrolase
MGRITTHILDITSGKPAAGVKIKLQRDGTTLCETVSNADGRCDAPLLEGDALQPGSYDLVFAIGDHFNLPRPRFLDEVLLRFGVSDTSQHYHVPLIATPWSYTTYRGS